MAPNFQQLLSKPAEQIEKPKPWPAGTYRGVIKGREFGESGQKKTPYLRLALSALSPGEEVDADALAQALKGKPISDRQFRRDFYITPDAEYRIVELAESCGISKAGRSLAELIEELPNQEVIFSMIQKPSQDGTELYNEVTEVKGVANL